MVEDDAPHQSTMKNREATYQFFQKHLNNPGDPQLMWMLKYFQEKELWVTEGGQLFKDEIRPKLFLINKKQTDLILR